MNLLAPTSDFTYASPQDTRWRRAVIHAIEQITGKPRLRRLYADYCRAELHPYLLPIDYAELSGFEDRRQLSDYLRALTYAPQRQP
ncbi:hypothetical protein [Pelagibius litoralis]|nr:hypothetical protein [Pelagibius litoralis]